MSRLRKLRKQKKMTQVNMQIRSGIDQSDYSKLERYIHNMSFEQCKRLALILGTSMDYLAEITDNAEPYQRNKIAEDLVRELNS